MASLYDTLRKKLNDELPIDSSDKSKNSHDKLEGLNLKYLSPSVNDINGSVYS